VSVRRVELLPALTFPLESTDHHHVVARINGLLDVGPELIEILRNGREDLIGHILSTVKGAPRRTPPAWLVPLDLRIKGREDGGNVCENMQQFYTPGRMA
jgi:hypothetical protein